MSNDTRAYLAMQENELGPGQFKKNAPDPNVRWGKRIPIQFKANTVANGQANANMVASPMFKNNIPFAFGFRFGDPNNPNAPLRPFIQPGTFGNAATTNILGFRVTIIRSIDAKTGPVTDTVDLAEGESMPVCELLARQINISVTVQAFDPGFDTKPWVIEVTAAPVDSINCDSLTEMGGWDTISVPSQNFGNLNPDLVGYKTLTSAAVDASPNPVLLLPANPRRTQFSLMNVGPIPIAIGFGEAVLTSPIPGIPDYPGWGTSATGSFPYASLILPGITDFSKEFARYESVLGGFTGPVWGVAQPGHAPMKGIINVTEGERPIL
jgi:hypothetical protein